MDIEGREDILKLIELSGIKAGIEKALTKTVEYSKQASAFLKSEVMPDVENIKQLFQLILEESDINELIDMIVPLFETHYQQHEIKTLIMFFDSDIGKVFREKSVTVNSEVENIRNMYISIVIDRIKQKYPKL